jgi:hypothetical protein
VGTYEHLFYVADVEATGSLMNGELHVGLDKSDFLALFPLKDSGRVRLVGAVSDQALTQRKTLTWDDVSCGNKSLGFWEGSAQNRGKERHLVDARRQPSDELFQAVVQ